MGLKILAAGASAVVIAIMAFAAQPADAQQTTAKKKSVTNQSTRVVVASRNRIRVAPRSFLDGGTEVLPGERKFTDYAFPAGEIGAPLSVVQGTTFNRETALPGPFYLPSRRNPWPWNYCVGC